MAITWTLSELRAKIRLLTGKRSTSQLSNDDLDAFINDYYQNRFPNEVQLDRLKSSTTQATSSTDSGQYTLSTDIVTLLTDVEEEPVTINGRRIKVYKSRTKFFDAFPQDGGAAYAITAPSLVIGTTSEAAVRYSAFSYRIGKYSYTLAAGETLLSGNTIPQNKYGAWRLEVDSSQVVSIVAAGANANGYDTPGKAVEGLETESAEKAAMGYVTAISTDSGGFIPGTTLLSASEVTDTYTDGFNKTRARPDAMLFDRGILYLRPKPDDIYQFESPIINKPEVLDGDSDTVAVIDWGPVVAYGTAIEILMFKDKDFKAAGDLQSMYDYYKGILTGNEIMQMSQMRAPATF